MSETGTNASEKPNEPKLPDGFRVLEEGEVLQPGYETRVDLTLEKTITNAPKKDAAPAQKFPDPKVIEVIIDPAQKQKEVPTPFSFTNPKVVQQAQSQPTKGDLDKKQQASSSDENLSDAEKLKKLDEEIKNEDAQAGKAGETYGDYKDTAEMAVEGYEGLVQLFGMWYSKDYSSASQYAFLEEKKKKLIHLGTKISRRRGWVLKPEYLFINNLVTETTRSVMKAKGNRSEYMKKRRQEESENKEPEIIKGGPSKGEVKTRGPGRPRK